MLVLNYNRLAVEKRIYFYQVIVIVYIFQLDEIFVK